MADITPLGEKIRAAVESQGYAVASEFEYASDDPFEPGQVSPQDIDEAVRELGYEISEGRITEGKRKPQPEESEETPDGVSDHEAPRDRVEDLSPDSSRDENAFEYYRRWGLALAACTEVQNAPKLVGYCLQLHATHYSQATEENFGTVYCGSRNLAIQMGVKDHRKVSERRRKLETAGWLQDTGRKRNDMTVYKLTIPKCACEGCRRNLQRLPSGEIVDVNLL